ncbi:hypothetical protein Droror1_Dr00006089 [Drosera rotundifolia]
MGSTVDVLPMLARHRNLIHLIHLIQGAYAVDHGGDFLKALDKELSSDFEVNFSWCIFICVINTVQCWALHKRGPIYVAMFKPLQMIITAVLGIMFLEDALRLGSVIGGATIAAGFYTVIQGKAKEIAKDKDSGISNSEPSPDRAAKKLLFVDHQRRDMFLRHRCFFAAQFFLKNVHPDMRKVASELFGKPELLHSRPNVLDELINILISPSESIEEAVDSVLSNADDPDISLHMRMLMNS